MPTRQVTSADIATAAKALKLNTPVRSAEWKGATLILHTRSGDFTYTPNKPARRAPAKKPAATRATGEKQPAS